MLTNKGHPERVNLYKIHQNSTKAYIAVGIVFLLLGIAMLISYMRFDTQFSGNNWNSVLYTGQGVVFILLGLYYLRYKKYFIEWNDNEIKFHLKGDKHTKRIEISNIRSVEIKINKVIIQTYSTKETIELNFEHIAYKELRRIKAKFEDIKTKINRESGTY